MTSQGWYPLGLTGLVSVLSKGLSRVFSNTTVRKNQFFCAQPSLWSNPPRNEQKIHFRHFQLQAPAYDTPQLLLLSFLHLLGQQHSLQFMTTILCGSPCISHSDSPASKDPCNYTGLAMIIQDDLLTVRSSLNPNCKFLRARQQNMFTGSGIRMWTLWRHDSASTSACHTIKKMVWHYANNNNSYSLLITLYMPSPLLNPLEI